MADAKRRIPFNDSGVRAVVTKETALYCVWEWWREGEQWVLVFADRNIAAAIDFARALRSEWWELREPACGIAFEASKLQRAKLDQEKKRRAAEKAKADRGGR